MNPRVIIWATLTACALCACEGQAQRESQSGARDTANPAPGMDSIIKASLPPTDTLRYPVLELDSAHNNLNPDRGGKRSIYRIPSGQGLTVETRGYKFPAPKHAPGYLATYAELLTDHITYRARWVPGRRVRLDRTTLTAMTGRSVFRGLRPGQCLLLTFIAEERLKGASQPIPAALYKTNIFVR